MFAQGFQSCLVKMKMASEAPFCFLDFLKVGKLEKGGILRLLSARQFEREKKGKNGDLKEIRTCVKMMSNQTLVLEKNEDLLSDRDRHRIK